MTLAADHKQANISIKASRPIPFPKVRIPPCSKGWKTEQRNRQELDSKDQLEKKQDKVQKLLVALSKAAGLNN